MQTCVAMNSINEVAYIQIPTMSPRSAVRNVGLASAMRSFAAYGAPTNTMSAMQARGVAGSNQCVRAEMRGRN
jgi:hypothetical protein